MSALTARILAAKAADRLALGLYLIPGQPDWETSLLAARETSARGVDFVEFPIIAGPGWSARTGSAIAGCLSASLPGICSWSEAVEEWLSAIPVGVGVVYASAWPEPDRWMADLRFRDHAAGLLLEPDVGDWNAYADEAVRQATPLVPTVDGCAECGREAVCDRLVRGSGFAYVSMGTRTGDRSADPRILNRQIAVINACRPELPVCCAFGIRGAADIAALRSLCPCDGVVVGTAAIEELQRGIEPFRRWLGSLEPVLDRSRSPGV
ncbi:MAG TPA: tryptophan synthase subunit alpha [Actinomycetota bacterium]